MIKTNENSQQSSMFTVTKLQRHHKTASDARQLMMPCHSNCAPYGLIYHVFHAQYV